MGLKRAQDSNTKEAYSMPPTPDCNVGQVNACMPEMPRRNEAAELAKLEGLYVSLTGLYVDGIWEFRSKLGAEITARRLGR